MAKEKIQIVIEDGELSGIKATENAVQILKNNRIKVEAVNFRRGKGDIKIFEEATRDDRLLPLDEDMAYERNCTEEEETELRKRNSISMPQVKCIRTLNEDEADEEHVLESGGYVLTNDMSYGIALQFMNEFNAPKWDGRGHVMKGVKTKDYFHVLPFEKQGDDEDFIDIWFARTQKEKQKWKIVVEVNGEYRTEVYRLGTVYALEAAIIDTWKISRQKEKGE